MSHFGVLVLTEADEDSETYKSVESLLAAYDENGEWFRKGSKWDWWVVGGRWTGYLDPSYDPYKDERNYSRCRYCEGTGITTQAIADEFPAYVDNVGKPCRQCNVGYEGPKPFPGRMLNYELVSQPSDTGLTAREVLERGVNPTFAIVTPDGEWHEKGEMGWFAVVTDEKAEDAWAQEWHDLMVLHQDCIATIVDCHV